MTAIFDFDDTDMPSANRAYGQPAPAAMEQNWPRLGGGGGKKTTSKPSMPLKAPAQAAVLGNLALPALPATLRATPASGAAQGGLAMLLAASRTTSRAPSDAGDIVAERAAEAHDQRGRKKKSKAKKGANRGAGISTAGLEKPDFLQPRTLKAPPSIASLAAAPTSVPAAMGDSEYTWSFKKQGQVSSASSTCSSPPRSGLSSLLAQMHPGDVVSLDTTDASEESDCGQEPLVAYEVAIDEEYISKDVDSRSTSRTASPSRKKMTADDFETLKCLGKGA